MRENVALYLHIPFCLQKCAYCDFVSYEKAQRHIPAYLDALEGEMALYAAQYGRLRIASVFLGGGTPSLLTGAEMARLLDAARRHFDVSPGAEITTEANPGTVDAQKLAAYRGAGINRVSFGAQAAQPHLLQRIERIHSWPDVQEAVRNAREAGFDNISLDLMFGLPGQTRADWRETLDLALAFSPEHLSCYALILEPGTRLHMAMQADASPLPQEEAERAMYDETITRLTSAGYAQYELSNFAKPGFACKHNIVYWTRGPYLGLGCAAHSLMEETRWGNVEGLDAYMQSIAQGALPRQTAQKIPPEERAEEALMLGLRLTQGLDIAEFVRQTGKSPQALWGSRIDDLERLGMLAQTPAHLRLTRRGMDLHGAVVQRILA